MTWLGPIAVERDDFGGDGLWVQVDDDGAGQGELLECDESDNLWVVPAFPCDP